MVITCCRKPLHIISVTPNNGAKVDFTPLFVLCLCCDLRSLLWTSLEKNTLSTSSSSTCGYRSVLCLQSGRVWTWPLNLFVTLVLHYSPSYLCPCSAAFHPICWRPQRWGVHGTVSYESKRLRSYYWATLHVQSLLVRSVQAVKLNQAPSAGEYGHLL